MTTNTRTDTKKFGTVVEKAMGHLAQATQALEGMTMLLTEKERQRVRRPAASFELVARPFAQALMEPANAALSEFAQVEPEAILEDVTNLEALGQLTVRVNGLLQRLTDTELVWRGEIDADVRAVYDAAKTRAKTDGKIAQLIAPLVEHYTPVRRAKTETPTPE